MKNATLAPGLFLLTVLFWSIACERTQAPTPTPVPPPVSLTTAVSSITAVSTPSDLVLKAFRIDGVPNENITVDQVSKQITVKLPDGYSKAQLKGTGQFDCKNCGFATGWGVDSLITMNWCSASDKPVIRLIYTNPGTVKGNVDYTLRVEPGGPLRVGPFPDYVVGKTWGIQIPVENFYETGAFSRGYVYHTQSGAMLDSVYIYCGDPDFKKNNVITIVGDFDLPGSCRFELVKSSGRRASVEFIVQKGVSLINSMVVVKTTAIKSFNLAGSNLYREDIDEVLLRHTSGYEALLKPIDFNLRGRKLTLQLPTDCQPGYYAMQPVKNGQRSPVQALGNTDLIVIDDARQPFLSDGLLFGPSGSLQKTVRPGEKIYVYVPINDDYAKNPITEYTFVNVEDETKRFTDNIYIPYGYFMGWTEGTGAYFNVPSAITPGRYRITPRRILANGDVINGITNPRIYEVN